MRMFDATLDLARNAQGIEQYKITSVGSEGNQFSCGALSAKLTEYTNGTAWFLTGQSEGQFGKILRASNTNIEMEDIYDDGFDVGDDVAISCFNYFSCQNLINAINHVLYTYPIMYIYEDITEQPVRYRHNQYEYELPDEVTTDIRRVELQVKDFRWPFITPYHVTIRKEWLNLTIEREPAIDDCFDICHYWHLTGRTLVIDPRFIYKWDGRIRIYFVKEHGPIIDKDTETISDQVDKNYLRKMANLWLWTHEIQMKHKDNPIAVDMYNQAKMDEEALNKKNAPRRNLMQKDVCYFW